MEMIRFVMFFTYRGVGLEIFVLIFDPEHTTPARVFRACLPWRAMVVCPETDRKARRRFLALIFTYFFQFRSKSPDAVD